MSWLVAASLCLLHPALMTCLHLLLLNLVQRGQLAVLCLLTPWEPCSAFLGSPAGMQGTGASHWAGSKLVFSELEDKH